MALKGKSRVGCRHAAAIVDDLNQRAPRILDDYGDFRGSGVDGVFHQLLDHRGRALDNLARRNLVGHGVREELDDVAHRRVLTVRIIES